jgi:hypothetical protein
VWEYNSGVVVGTCESAQIGTSGGLKRDVSECLRFYDFFKCSRSSCKQPITARQRERDWVSLVKHMLFCGL